MDRNNRLSMGAAHNPDEILRRRVGYYFRDELPAGEQRHQPGRKLRIRDRRIYEIENGAAFGSMTWPPSDGRKYYQAGDIIFRDHLTPKEWAQVVPKWNYEEESVLEELMSLLLILAGISDIFPERYLVGWRVEEIEWDHATQRGAAILRPLYKAAAKQPWLALPYRLRFSPLELNRFFAAVQAHVNHRWWMGKAEVGTEIVIDIGRTVLSGGSSKAAKWVSTKGAGLILIKLLKQAKVRRKLAFKLFKLLNAKLSGALIQAVKKSLKTFIAGVESARDLQRYRSEPLNEAQWKLIFDKALEAFAKQLAEELFDLIVNRKHYRAMGIIFRKNFRLKTLFKKMIYEFIIDLHLNFISKELAGLAVNLWRDPKMDMNQYGKKMAVNPVIDGLQTAKGRVVDRYIKKHTNEMIDRRHRQVRDFANQIGRQLVDVFLKRIKENHGK